MACWLIAGRALSAETGAHLFQDGVFTRVQIEIDQQSVEVLRGYSFKREDPRQERPSVRCVVREGANVWTNVAMHLKGSLGSFRPIDERPSVTLNFSKHISGQRFHGLEKISLNSSVQDPTRISEKICRELYLQAGVPVPRAGHATVELNGRLLGLYVLLEGWNRQFIERHFADARGPLYEGPFFADIDEPLLVAYGKRRYGGLKISDLLMAARESHPTNRLKRLQKVLDVDRFIRLLAMDLLLWNGDGYALHANNYRIFHDRAQERFVFLPHGMDQMLVLTDAPILAAGDGIVASALLAVPEGRERVLNQLRIFRNSIVTPETVSRRVRAMAGPIGLEIARQAGGNNSSVDSAHASAVVGWLTAFSNRLASVDEQLIGIKTLVPLSVGQAVPVNNWTNRTLAGQPGFSSAPDQRLAVTTTPGSTGAWASVHWLEHGHYTLHGRIKGTAPGADTSSVQVEVLVQAPRKRSLGLDWGWDSRRRAEHLPRAASSVLTSWSVPITTNGGWTTFTMDIDLRQPVADLIISVQASGNGEVVLDASAVRLTRITEPGR